MKRMTNALIGLCLLSGAAMASIVVINDNFDEATSQITSDVDGYVNLNDTDGLWHKSSSSAWAHGLGNDWVYNTSNDGGNISDGALAKIVDLSGLGLTTENALDVSFSFVSWNGATPDDIYVHLWGVVDVSAGGTEDVGNLAAQSGNMWAAISTAYDIYGLDDGYKFTAAGDGGAGNAAITLLDQNTGTALIGDAVNYSTRFYLSGHTIDTLAGYDYLVMGFTRNPDAGTGNSLAIYNVNVTAEAIPEPSSLALILIVLPALALSRRRWSNTGKHGALP